MQLITPFPRSVALADPRSALAPARVQYAIDYSARQDRGSSPEALSACRRAFSAGIRRYRHPCHHHHHLGFAVKSFCSARSVGAGRVRTAHEHAHAHADALSLFTYCTQRTRQVGLAIPRMKHNTNAHAHDHSSASRYPNGGMGRLRPPTPADRGRHIMGGLLRVGFN